MSRKKTSPARGPAIAAVSLAAALVLGEGLARLRFRKNIQDLKFAESDLYYYTDRGGARRHVPGKTGRERMWNDQGKAEFRINSHGLRGREIPKPKPPGVSRALFLGDSITLGGRLPEEATFVERVGRALEAREPGRWQVLNAGVGDAGLAEEEELLRGTGLALEPDLVVLGWYLNDARPPVGFAEENVYRHPLIGWFDRRAILSRSHLAGLVYDALRKWIARRQLTLMDAQTRRFDWVGAYNDGAWVKDEAEFRSLVAKARYDWGDAWDEASLAAMARRVEDLAKDLRARGVRFAVLALPVHAQVYAKFSSPLVDFPQRRMGERMAKAGIPYLDLIPVLRTSPKSPPFYDWCHYTPDGNEVVARAVLEFLLQSKLL